MSFVLSPTTAAPGVVITATGKTTKRATLKVFIENSEVTSGKANPGGNFTLTFKTPTGVDRTVSVVLKYLRSDGVWAQTASASLTVKNTVTPQPEPEPEPTPISVPSAPVNFRATTGDRQVNTLWSAPTSNGGSPVATYKIYRNGVYLTSVPTLNYTDSNLVNGVTYTYQVSAVNAAGEGPKSNQVSATPNTIQTTFVTSISALKAALANNLITDITMQDGTYAATPATSQLTNSLWIGGGAIKARTNPVYVRAQTPGGVKIDLGGGVLGGIIFIDGAHDQTWDGFVFQNGDAKQTGVIVFGGFSGYTGPHHITLKNITIPPSAISSVPVGEATGHAVYFSNAVGGPHDILIDGLTLTSSISNSIDSVIHFYHSGNGEVNAWNVTVKNMTVTGSDQSIIIWDSTVHDVLFEDCNITNASEFAIRYEAGSNIIFRRVNSTGSGSRGFYSSKGTNPAGVTFDNCSLN